MPLRWNRGRSLELKKCGAISGQALKFPEIWGSQISWQSAH
jgi:hypothetical protein